MLRQLAVSASGTDDGSVTTFDWLGHCKFGPQSSVSHSHSASQGYGSNSAWATGEPSATAASPIVLSLLQVAQLPKPARRVVRLACKSCFSDGHSTTSLFFRSGGLVSRPGSGSISRIRRSATRSGANSVVVARNELVCTGSVIRKFSVGYRVSNARLTANRTPRDTKCICGRNRAPAFGFPRTTTSEERSASDHWLSLAIKVPLSITVGSRAPSRGRRRNRSGLWSDRPSRPPRPFLL